MLYIICAFEAEARALIDAYKLVKSERTPYALFTNEDVILLISKMGQVNARTAAKFLVSNYKISQDDCFLNLGICAAKDNYTIGKLLQIKYLENENESFTLSTLTSSVQAVSCFSANEPVDKIPKTDIAEMEAISLYKNVKDYFQCEKISFLKIVSDHFQPAVFKKQFIIQLVHKNLKDIRDHIQQLKGENSEK